MAVSSKDVIQNVMNLVNQGGITYEEIEEGLSYLFFSKVINETVSKLMIIGVLAVDDNDVIYVANQPYPEMEFTSCLPLYYFHYKENIINKRTGILHRLSKAGKNGILIQDFEKDAVTDATFNHLLDEQKIFNLGSRYMIAPALNNPFRTSSIQTEASVQSAL